MSHCVVHRPRPPGRAPKGFFTGQRIRWTGASDLRSANYVGLICVPTFLTYITDLLCRANGDISGCLGLHVDLLFGLAAWPRERSGSIPKTALARLWMGWVQAPLARGPVAQWIRHRPTEPGIVGLSPVAGQSKTSRCAPKLFSPGKTWLERTHLTFTAKSGLICASTSHELAVWSSGMTLWEDLGSIPRTALARLRIGWVQAPLAKRSCGPMDKASAHRAGDCRLESYQGHIILSFCDSREIPCPTVLYTDLALRGALQKVFFTGQRIRWKGASDLHSAKSGLFAPPTLLTYITDLPPRAIGDTSGCLDFSWHDSVRGGAQFPDSALARLWIGWVQAPLARRPVAQWIRHRPTEPGIVGLTPVAGQSKTSRCAPKLFSPGKTWLDRAHLTFTAKSGLVCPSTSHELALWSSGMTLWEGRDSIPRTALAKSCRGWVQARLP